VSARGKARKRALDVLYEADVRQVPALDVLAAHRADTERPVNEHTVAIVEGVAAHRERIDDLITTYATGWTLDRMPAVDRNLIRIGTWEILYADDVPDAVAVAEAVGLARELSTDDSPSFVNGLLARILELKPRLALD